MFALLSFSALVACTGEPAPNPEPVVAPPGDVPAPIGGAPLGNAPGALSAADAQKSFDAALTAVKAKPGTSSKVTIDGVETTIWSWEDPRLIVSDAVCAPGGTLGACKALDAVRDIQTKTVDIGPGNPSAYYCEPAGGKSVAGVGSEGESSMCRFDDGSMVSDWSLVYVPQFGRAALAAPAH